MVRFRTRGRLPGQFILLSAAGAFLAIYAGLLPLEGTRRFLGGLGYPLPPLVALGFSILAAMRTSGRRRVGWWCIVGLLVSWEEAELTYSYYSLVLDAEAPFPGLPDLLYYAGYAFLLVGFWLLASPRQGRYRLLSLLDAAIVVVAAGTFTWAYVLSSSDPKSFGGVVSLGYPLIDLALVVVLSAAMYGERRERSPAFALLMLGTAALVVADSAFAVEHGEAVAQADWLDLGWLASYWFFASAAFEAAREGTRSAQECESTSPSLIGLSLPYVATTPLIAAVVWDSWANSLDSISVAGALCTTVLLLARQLLTLAENGRLNRALERQAEELRVVNARAQFLADYDSLTGVLTRRAWIDRVLADRPGAIAIVDIDHFKRINDRLGHAAGDRVLKMVATLLQETAPGNTVVGRLGGEEFGLAFCPSSECIGGCQQMVDAINGTILSDGERSLAVTVSAGLFRPLVGRAWSERELGSALEAADGALYEAKREGRARLVEWSGQKALIAG